MYALPYFVELESLWGVACVASINLMFRGHIAIAGGNFARPFYGKESELLVYMGVCHP